MAPSTAVPPPPYLGGGAKQKEDHSLYCSLALAGLGCCFTSEQWCQIVFVKMREKIVKMREKMRQPKMSKILLHFWTFGRGYKNQS